MRLSICPTLPVLLAFCTLSCSQVGHGDRGSSSVVSLSSRSLFQHAFAHATAEERAGALAGIGRWAPSTIYALAQGTHSTRTPSVVIDGRPLDLTRLTPMRAAFPKALDARYPELATLWRAHGMAPTALDEAAFTSSLDDYLARAERALRGQTMEAASADFNLQANFLVLLSFIATGGTATNGSPGAATEYNVSNNRLLSRRLNNSLLSTPALALVPTVAGQMAPRDVGFVRTVELLRMLKSNPAQVHTGQAGPRGPAGTTEKIAPFISPIWQGTKACVPARANPDAKRVSIDHYYDNGTEGSGQYSVNIDEDGGYSLSILCAHQTAGGYVLDDAAREEIQGAFDAAGNLLPSFYYGINWHDD